MVASRLQQENEGDILARMADRPAYAFFGASLLLRQDADGLRVPTLAELRELVGDDRLARARIPASVRTPTGPAEAYGFAEGDGVLPEGFRLDGLRVAYHGLSAAEFRSAGAAWQKIDWYRSHRFCSRCGSGTAIDAQRESMDCSACGQRHFARIAPAVIVLIQRGREALLGRSRHFPPGVYSTLAGFVEPGESLEECVHREIEEEVGVRVAELRYFGSQPHPFPHSLMVGFIADWVEGEIRIDPNELEDARWFDCEQLPTLPHPMSIARALIEDFRARCR
jgi:NAD+ diphosphatase